MINILYLDDEVQNLTAFRAAFRRDFTIHITSEPSEALQFLEQHPIEVVISDQKMPGLSGVEFFELIMPDHPNPVRILLTGYADIDAVIDAINKGRIYKYISKPWNEAEIRKVVQEASDLYQSRTAQDIQVTEYSERLDLAKVELEALETDLSSSTELSTNSKDYFTSSVHNVLELIQTPS